jgi:hypothetical protein
MYIPDQQGNREDEPSCPSSAVRPIRDPRPGAIGCSDAYLTNTSSALFEAATWYLPLSSLKMIANSASQRLDAIETILSRTGCRSKVERLTTFSNSAVAACCSSASSSCFLRAVVEDPAWLFCACSCDAAPQGHFRLAFHDFPSPPPVFAGRFYRLKRIQEKGGNSEMTHC